jgi:hypothetical protein
VVPSPNPGSSGNHLYGVTAIGPRDVWAVGQQLSASGPDQALIEHWDGSRWSTVPSPHSSGSAGLWGVAAGHAGLWAVGETDDAVQGALPLVEQYRVGAWTPVSLPQAGSRFTSLWAVTVSEDKAWAAGTYFDPSSGTNKTLILSGDEGGWAVANAPSPGAGDNVLGGIAAAGDTVWAVGYYKDPGRLQLIERHQES